MKKALINIGLFVFAVLALPTIGGLGLLYGTTVHASAFPDKAYTMAVIIDILANAMCPELLRDLLLVNKDTPYPFGVKKQTISYALMMNEKMNNLSPMGRWLYDRIDQVDPGHFTRVTF